MGHEPEYFPLLEGRAVCRCGASPLPVVAKSQIGMVHDF
jgi:hypothetical protein